MRFEALSQRLKSRANKGWTMYKKADKIYHALFYVFYSEKLGNFIAYMKILTCKNSKKKRFFDEIFECNLVFNRIERLIEDCFYIVFRVLKHFQRRVFTSFSVFRCTLLVVFSHDYKRFEAH